MIIMSEFKLYESMTPEEQASLRLMHNGILNKSSRQLFIEIMTKEELAAIIIGMYYGELK